MLFAFINDVFEYLNNKFEGEIPNLLYFFIGLCGGIIIFFISLSIFYLIQKVEAKRINKVKDKNISKDLIIQDEYIGIIKSSIDIYNNTYKNQQIKEKFIGFGKIFYSMLENIAMLYYPKSDDPIFEISLEQLVDFLQYAVYRIEYLTDNIISNHFSIIEKIVRKDIKDIKLKFVFEMLQKKLSESDSKISNPEKSNSFIKKM